MNITTISLCPICYKKIEAEIKFESDGAWMYKECDQHGIFRALVDPDIQHVSNFYHMGTLGRNNTIIVHTHNSCNMKCSWCYYEMGSEKLHPFKFYDTLLAPSYLGHSLLFSGGEPTLRPDFFEFNREAYELGWKPSNITNMISLGDTAFFNKVISEPDVYVTGNTLRFALSVHTPKHYTQEVLDVKSRALANIEGAGLQAMCAMFTITSLDEIPVIRKIYDSTKHLYGMLRIRTLFKNWNNKNNPNNIYLSELHKEFLKHFGDLAPVQSLNIERSNIYCLYMQLDDGMNVSLSSAPTVENLDYHICSRPVFMLGQDYRCYPVPIAQIINEGISLGWKDGFRLAEV